MAAGSTILQLLILGIFFTSGHLCGEESNYNQTKQSSDCKEPDAGKEETAKTNGSEASNLNKDNVAKKNESKEEDTNKESAAKAKEEKPAKIGNFSLPASQQPSALFGFGGNIIDKGEIQLYFFADDFQGKKENNDNTFTKHFIRNYG